MTHLKCLVFAMRLMNESIPASIFVSCVVRCAAQNSSSRILALAS